MKKAASGEPKIGPGYPRLIVADATISHNHDPIPARRIMETAARAGAGTVNPQPKPKTHTTPRRSRPQKTSPTPTPATQSQQITCVRDRPGRVLLVCTATDLTAAQMRVETMRKRLRDLNIQHHSLEAKKASET